MTMATGICTTTDTGTGTGTDTITITGTGTGTGMITGMPIRSIPMPTTRLARSRR
jgi:hypothetical protein